MAPVTYQVCSFFLMVDVVIEADELSASQEVKGAASQQHKNAVLGRALVLTLVCV